jgi:hypothetical protein
MALAQSPLRIKLLAVLNSSFASCARVAWATNNNPPIKIFFNKENRLYMPVFALL